MSVSELRGLVVGDYVGYTDVGGPRVFMVVHIDRDERLAVPHYHLLSVRSATPRTVTEDDLLEDHWGPRTPSLSFLKFHECPDA